jgi:hypothetical protein
VGLKESHRPRLAPWLFLFMIKTHLPILPLLLVLVSCGSRPTDTSPKLNFVLDPKDHDFALETTTGTLCKTWQWEHDPKQPIDAIPVCFMIGH